MQSWQDDFSPINWGWMNDVACSRNAGIAQWPISPCVMVGPISAVSQAKEAAVLSVAQLKSCQDCKDFQVSTDRPLVLIVADALQNFL